MAVGELELTRSVTRNAQSLFPPGRGRSLFALEEVDLGIGRPDVLLLHASSRSVEAHLRDGRRLENLTEAEILASHFSGRPSRHTGEHETAVLRRLREAGWLRRSKVRVAAGVIGKSLLVEAKLTDWRRGLVQLTRENWACDFAALAYPRSIHERVERVMLRRNRLGLIVVAGEDASWRIKARQSAPTLAGRLWLTELLARSLEA